MNTRIILINGKKRSGKDYFAEQLKLELNSCNKRVHIISFADAIKEILCVTLGISILEFNEYKNNEKYIIMPNGEKVLFRQIIQRFGTDAMQTTFGKNVWVDILKKEADATKADFVLVPDFRFLQEDISDFKIQIIDRNIISTDKHISENQLNDFRFDYIIDNTDHSKLQQSIEDYTEYLLELS